MVGTARLITRNNLIYGAVEAHHFWLVRREARGTFYVITNKQLNSSVSSLIGGDTAN